MTFKWPVALWGVLLVPIATACYLMWLRRRAAAGERFARSEMHPNVVPARPRWRRHVPVALYLLASAALLVGVARPQAAFTIPREKATVMLVIDSSRSMRATDVKPDRLTAAQKAAADFLGAIPPDFQVGLVTFADAAKVMSRATTDRVAVTRALEDLRMSTGTAIGDGIWRALLAQRQRPGDDARLPPTAIILLSDGNNTTGGMHPLDAAQRARQAGVRIYSVALGRPDPPAGWKGPRPPDHDLLREVGRIAEGAFFSAPTNADLQAIYQNLGSSIAMVEEQREVTAAFVAAGLLLLLGGGGLAVLWFNRLP